MLKRQWLVVALAGLMAAPTLAGCGEDIATGPPQRDRRDRGGNGGATEASVDDYLDFEESEEYTRPDYPLRRNPFQPDLNVVGGSVQETEAQDLRPTEPLEEFAISQLSLVTIISETAVPKAMFVDPTGHGHIAKEGDRIGLNNGVIRVIRSNEVEVREGDDRGSAITVRLRERELRSEQEQLSEEEQEALRRLLGSEEGREALRREISSGQSGQAPPSGQQQSSTDRRFPGLAPPGQTNE